MIFIQSESTRALVCSLDLNYLEFITIFRNLILHLFEASGVRANIESKFGLLEVTLRLAVIVPEFFFVGCLFGESLAFGLLKPGHSHFVVILLFFVVLEQITCIVDRLGCHFASEGCAARYLQTLGSCYTVGHQDLVCSLALLFFSFELGLELKLGLFFSIDKV